MLVATLLLYVTPFMVDLSWTAYSAVHGLLIILPQGPLLWVAEPNHLTSNSPFTLNHQSGNLHDVFPPCVPHSTAVPSVVAAHHSLESGATESPASLTQQAPTTGGTYACVCACLCACVFVHCTVYICVCTCMKFDGFVPLVWLNRLLKLVLRNRLHSHCSFGTSLGCMWSHTQVASMETTCFSGVDEDHDIHGTKNRHFVSVSMHLGCLNSTCWIFQVLRYGQLTLWKELGLNRFARNSFRCERAELFSNCLGEPVLTPPLSSYHKVSFW